MSWFFLIGGIFFFFYPHRRIRSDSVPFGSYHLLDVLKIYTKEKPEKYILSLLFPFFLMSSYSIKKSFQVYYMNHFISLKRTVSFLWRSEIGSALFIIVFITLLNWVDVLYILTFVGIYSLLFHVLFQSKEQSHYSLVWITFFVGIYLLDYSNSLDLVHQITSSIYANPLAFHSVSFFTIGLVSCLIFKDALMIKVIIFYFLYQSMLYNEAMVFLLLGCIWAEDIISFFNGNHYKRSKTLFSIYIHYTLSFTIIFLVLYYISSPTYFWTLYGIYLVSIVMSVLLNLFFIRSLISYVKKISSRVFRKYDHLQEITLGSRDLFKSAEINLVMSRKILSKISQMNYDVLFKLISYRQESGMEAIIRESKKNKIKVKEARGKIELILRKTMGLPTSKNNQMELVTTQEMTQFFYIMNKTISKICLTFDKIQDKEYFKNEHRDFIFEYLTQTIDFLKYNNDYMRGKINRLNLKLAEDMEENIDREKEVAYERALKIIPEKTRNESILFFDIIKYIEHIGDFNLSISRSLNDFHYKSLTKEVISKKGKDI